MHKGEEDYLILIYSKTNQAFNREWKWQIGNGLGQLI